MSAGAIFILGLVARAGHGKTTVARHLAAAHGAELRSLAGPLKRAVQRVFDLSDAQLWGTQAEKEAIDPRYGFSARWLLQRLGTEGLREHFGADVHQRALLSALRREAAARPADAPPRLYVVDDIRFPDDARFIAAGGPDFHGAVMKVVSTDAPAGTNAGHASELAIDDIAASDIAATVVSSRARGIPHLLGAVDEALRTAPGLAALRPALRAPRQPPAEPARPPALTATETPVRKADGSRD